MAADQPDVAKAVQEVLRKTPNPGRVAQSFQFAAMPSEVMVCSDSKWAVCREIRARALVVASSGRCAGL